MPNAKLSDLMGRIGPAGGSDINAATDAELLARFVASRDDAAFAELVRRYGGLVFGMCRRLIGHHQLAEDAFQAVFVVLAAKAASVRPPAVLPAWLHGVAWRTALRARTVANRRNRREMPASPMPERPAPEPKEVLDAVSALDEEIARLPDHYRVPIILCELEGRSRKETAAALKIAEGTLSSRLAAARKRLAARLRSRGVVLSVSAMSMALGQASAVQPPAGLAAKTALAALRGPIPVLVASLSQGVLRTMFLNKLKLAFPFALLTTGLLAWATVAAMPTDEPPPVTRATPQAPPTMTRVDPPVKTEPKPIPKGPNLIMIWKEGKTVILAPDGRQISEAPFDRKKYALLGLDGKPVEIPYPGKSDKKDATLSDQLLDPSFSPDGKLVAFIVESPRKFNTPPPANNTPPFLPSEPDFNYLRSVLVHELGGEGRVTEIEIAAQNLAWTSDGKLLVVEAVSAKDKRERRFATWLADVATKEKTKIDLPEGTQVFAATPDGKSFLAVTYDAKEKKLNLASIAREGAAVTLLTAIRGVFIQGMPSSRPRLSPDGTRILFADVDVEEKLEEGMTRLPRLFLYDMKLQKRERLTDVPLNAWVQEFAWSPNSKQFAYVWKRMEPGVSLYFHLDRKGNYVDKDGNPDPKIMSETETHLSIADANGKNSKTILSAKGKYVPMVTLMKLDWR